MSMPISVQVIVWAAVILLAVCLESGAEQLAREWGLR